MTIEFRCGQCNQLLRVPDNSSGKNARCPKCQALMQIPAASDAASTGASAPPPPFPSSAVPPPPLPGQGSGGFPSFGAPPAGSHAPPASPAPSDDPFAFLKGDAPAKAPLPPPAPPPPPANPFGDFGEAKTPPPGASTNPYAASASVGYFPVQTPAMGGRCGLPWEASRPSIASWSKTFQLVIGSPSRAFEQMWQQGDIGRPFFYAMSGAALSFLLSIVVGVPIKFLLFLVLGEDFGGALVSSVSMVLIYAAFSFVAMLVFFPVTLFVSAGIFHLSLMIFGPVKQQFETTFRVVCYVQGAMGPIGTLLNMIPFNVGAMINSVWSLYLLIVGLSRAHEVSAGKAALAVLVPVFLCFAATLGFVALVVLGALTSAFGR